MAGYGSGLANWNAVVRVSWEELGVVRVDHDGEKRVKDVVLRLVIEMLVCKILMLLW